MEKRLLDRLKEAMKARKISTPKLAEQLDIPKDRIYAWYRDNTTPKSEDQTKLEKWLKNEDFSKNDLPERGTIVGPVSNDIILKILNEIANEHNKLIDAHKTVVESNKIQAEANKIQAEANKEAADANKLHAKNQETILAQLKSPERDAQGIPSETDETFSRLLAVLAMIGTGKHWRNEAEAIKELNKLVPLRGSDKI